MKKSVQYICEKCSRCFKNEQDALDCENNHGLPVEVLVPLGYKSGVDEVFEHRVPNRVIVKMSNGKVARYDYNGLANSYEYRPKKDTDLML